jgi:hypothetical protein
MNVSILRWMSAALTITAISTAGWLLGRTMFGRDLPLPVPLQPAGRGASTLLAPEAPPPSWEKARTLSRTWERVSYNRVFTPWGMANAGASPNSDGLRFSLTWSGPGTDDPEGWKSFKQPDATHLRAALWCDGSDVALPKNGIPELMAWVGGSRGTSGTVSLAFDLPLDESKDYWVRMTMRDQTDWFLIPYGIAGRGIPGPFQSRKQYPPKPVKPTPENRVHVWDEVTFDFGWLPGKCRVTVAVSNEFDAAAVVTLYSDDPSVPWDLEHPRTRFSVALPDRYVVQSTPVGADRKDPFRRNDRFALWRNSGDKPAWGVLRVTVAETTFERLIPSSIFGYCQGRLAD